VEGQEKKDVEIERTDASVLEGVGKMTWERLRLLELLYKKEGGV
jgi:hypothetical protein